MSWDNSWIDRAKRLPVGDKIRVRCCGLDNSRTIANKVDCYITGCFRCKESAVERKTPLAYLKSHEELRKYKEKVHKKELNLTEDLDSNAVEWLILADIKPHLWKKYHIKQCLDTGMVFLPIPINRKYNGFILRNVRGGKPKYISEVNRGFAALGEGRTVVIVEDYLSAIRVHEDTGLSTLCALGTSTPPELKLHVMNNHDTAVLWLDSDEAGRKADRAWNKELTALGLNVKSVVTEADPKLLSTEQIREVLESIHVGT